VTKGDPSQQCRGLGRQEPSHRETMRAQGPACRGKVYGDRNRGMVPARTTPHAPSGDRTGVGASSHVVSGEGRELTGYGIKREPGCRNEKRSPDANPRFWRIVVPVPGAGRMGGPELEKMGGRRLLQRVACGRCVRPVAGFTTLGGAGPKKAVGARRTLELSGKGPPEDR